MNAPNIKSKLVRSEELLDEALDPPSKPRLRCLRTQPGRSCEVTNDLVISGKLVNAEQMLEQVFHPDARPSLRWVRTQTKKKAIVHLRIGRLVFFDVDMVRASLALKNLVRGRMKA